jgi:hypothetical protein
MGGIAECLGAKRSRAMWLALTNSEEEANEAEALEDIEIAAADAARTAEAAE